MRLNDLERGMLAGELGAAAKSALEHQVKVGDFFGAADFVPVTQAHIMADTESLGETGVVIYANSVCGARSNYEGGPSAVAAGLTGRAPRYGFHLDGCRRATLRIEVDLTPKTLNEWGAL